MSWGRGNSNSAHFNYHSLDSGADPLRILGQVINIEKLPLEGVGGGSLKILLLKDYFQKSNSLDR